MARENYPDNVFISPCFAIKRFLGLREKYGDRKAVTNNRFKPEREAWIAGVFLAGFGQRVKREYWLRMCKEETPDIIAVSFTGGTNGVVMELQNIEIFEYERHFKGSLVESIKEKLAGKAYPDDYTLLCYAHSRTGESFDTKEIFEELKKQRINTADLWIILSPMGENYSEHVAFRGYPAPALINFDYAQVCRTTKQVEMIKPSRGLDKEVKFTPLGKYVLKLP